MKIHELVNILSELDENIDCNFVIADNDDNYDAELYVNQNLDGSLDITFQLDNNLSVGFNASEDRVDTYFFGISSYNQNETKFKLVRTTDNESFTDFSITDIQGVGILDEDFDVVEEIAINLFDSIAIVTEFDSVRGDTFYIYKLSEDDYDRFITSEKREVA